MHQCMFKDDISQNPYFRNSYIHLVSSFDKNLRVTFNRKGKPSKAPCREFNRKKRRRNLAKCIAEATSFLSIPVENQSLTDPCSCPESYEYFCRSKLRWMREFRYICSFTEYNRKED